MSGWVWRIWTNRRNQKGGTVYWNIELQLGSLRDITEKLSSGHFILGDVLDTETAVDAAGERYWNVLGRRPMAIGPQAITTVEPIMSHRFLENGQELVNGRWT